MVSGSFGSLFSLMFLLVIGVFIAGLFKNFSTWNKNNNSPRLSVTATAVSKRISVSESQQPIAGDATGSQGYMTNTSTTYYVTFQVESGDRMEFHVSGNEYGLIIEGDTGKLTFQGTRFLSFER